MAFEVINDKSKRNNIGNKRNNYNNFANYPLDNYQRLESKINKQKALIISFCSQEMNS